jgi:hypothetical protein
MRAIFDAHLPVSTLIPTVGTLAAPQRVTLTGAVVRFRLTILPVVKLNALAVRQLCADDRQRKTPKHLEGASPWHGRRGICSQRSWFPKKPKHHTLMPLLNIPGLIAFELNASVAALTLSLFIIISSLSSTSFKV